MIQEIQRLKSLGLGKKTVARALGISRNTVKQYWELHHPTATPVTGAAGQSPAVEAILAAARPRYEAPWGKGVEWEAVKQGVDAGEALAIWLEDQQGQGGATSPLRGVAYTSFWREFKRRYRQPIGH